MKILLYLVLVIAFLMFYQYSPVVAMIVIVLFLGAFVYFKARKNGGSLGRGSFFSGRQPQNQDNIDNLITLVMLQQAFNKPGNSYIDKKPLEDKDATEREKIIDQTRKEVLQLLEE